jgi:hypothetical protein
MQRKKSLTIFFLAITAAALGLPLGSNAAAPEPAGPNKFADKNEAFAYYCEKEFAGTCGGADKKQITITGGGLDKLPNQGCSPAFPTYLGCIKKLEGGVCCGKAGAETAGAGPAAAEEFKMPEIDPAEFIGRVIKLIFGVSGSLAFAMILYGGFLWLTSGGAPETITKAKNIVIWAVLGLMVIFAAYAIVANVTKIVLQAVTQGK